MSDSDHTPVADGHTCPPRCTMPGDHRDHADAGWLNRWINQHWADMGLNAWQQRFIDGNGTGRPRGILNIDLPRQAGGVIARDAWQRAISQATDRLAHQWHTHTRVGDTIHATQLRPIDITAFGDTHRQRLMPDGTVHTGETTMANSTCALCGATNNDGWVCTTCTRETRNDLNTITRLAADATHVARNQARPGNPTVNTSQPPPASRPPLNVHAYDTIALHTERLATIAADLSEQMWGNAAANIPTSLTGLTTWLYNHTDAMRQASDGPGRSFAARTWPLIGKAARALERIVNGAPERQYLGPCGTTRVRPIIRPVRFITREEADAELRDPPATNTETYTCDGDVYADRGAAYGQCNANECRAEYSVQGRRAWLDDVVRDHLFTAAEIADAYGIPRNTINQWATRGRLVTRGLRNAATGPRQYPAYRVGDVLDLWHDSTRTRNHNRARGARVEGSRMTFAITDETRTTPRSEPPRTDGWSAPGDPGRIDGRLFTVLGWSTDGRSGPPTDNQRRIARDMLARIEQHDVLLPDAWTVPGIADALHALINYPRGRGRCGFCRHDVDQHTTTIGGTAQCHGTAVGPEGLGSQCQCTNRTAAAQTHPRVRLP